MRADGRLEEPGDPGDERARRRPDDEHEDHVEDRVQPLERGADPHGEDGAGEVLALAADVEEAAAEGERDREPDEDQRRRRDQRLLEVERGDEALLVPSPTGRTS